MTHLLDTCICVFLIRSRSQKIRDRIETFEIGDLAVSAVTEAELRYGADKSQDPDKNHRQLDHLFLTLPVVPFDSLAAVAYGKLRAELERIGKVIGPLDMLIAAHARSLELVVVTNNVGEFSRVSGLSVEDWGAEFSKK